MLPKIGTCRRDFDETKFMSFLIKNYKLLRKYNENWDKASNTAVYKLGVLAKFSPGVFLG